MFKKNIIELDLEQHLYALTSMIINLNYISEMNIFVIKNI